MAKKKGWMTLLAVVTLVGGAVHLLQPLGFDLLSFAGSFSGWVQGIAGALTIGYVGKKQWM